MPKGKPYGPPSGGRRKRKPRGVKDFEQSQRQRLQAQLQLAQIMGQRGPKRKSTGPGSKAELTRDLAGRVTGARRSTGINRSKQDLEDLKKSKTGKGRVSKPPRTKPKSSNRAASRPGSDVVRAKVITQPAKQDKTRQPGDSGEAKFGRDTARIQNRIDVLDRSIANLENRSHPSGFHKKSTADQLARKREQRARFQAQLRKQSSPISGWTKPMFGQHYSSDEVDTLAEEQRKRDAKRRKKLGYGKGRVSTDYRGAGRVVPGGGGAN